MEFFDLERDDPVGNVISYAFVDKGGLSEFVGYHGFAGTSSIRRDPYNKLSLRLNVERFDPVYSHDPIFDEYVSDVFHMSKKSLSVSYRKLYFEDETDLEEFDGDIIFMEEPFEREYFAKFHSKASMLLFCFVRDALWRV